MVQSRNGVAAVLSVVAGVLLIVSGTHGPVGTYEFILGKLPSLISDQFILSVATWVAMGLIGISLLGGFVVLICAYLFYKDHGRREVSDWLGHRSRYSLAYSHLGGFGYGKGCSGGFCSV